MSKFLNICVCILIFGSTSVKAGTIENLERERALVIEKLLDPNLTPDDRNKKLVSSKSRLIDLERMVLRDKSLNGRNTPTIRRAFENYDLTFLIHASTEHNLLVTDNWLKQLGLTTHSIMSAAISRR